MGLFDFFRRDKTDPEVRRRTLLTQFGRIAEGTILEGRHTEDSGYVSYIYSVNGADYESSDKLTGEQSANAIAYAPGAKVTVRYDPAQPGNSILI